MRTYNIRKLEKQSTMNEFFCREFKRHMGEIGSTKGALRKKYKKTGEKRKSSA